MDRGRVTRPQVKYLVKYYVISWVSLYKSGIFTMIEIQTIEGGWYIDGSRAISVSTVV